LLLNRRKARATRQLQGSLALTTNHASEPLHILKGIARQELRLEDVQDFWEKKAGKSLPFFSSQALLSCTSTSCPSSLRSEASFATAIHDGRACRAFMVKRLLCGTPDTKPSTSQHAADGWTSKTGTAAWGELSSILNYLQSLANARSTIAWITPRSLSSKLCHRDSSALALSRASALASSTTKKPAW